MKTSTAIGLAFALLGAMSALSDRGWVSGAEAVAAEPARRLPLEGAVNFRDLGGYATADGRRVRWGVLYRSDALDTLTPADWALLDPSRISRITDFRAAAEAAKRPDRLPEALRERYVNLPLDDTPARNNPEIAKQAEAAAAEFMGALKSTDDSKRVETINRLIVDYYYPQLPRKGALVYRQWMQGLLDDAQGASQIFHCTGGADRTGFAAAMLLLTLGVPKEAVISDYLLTNDFFLSTAAADFTKQKGLPQMPATYRLQADFLEAAFRAAEADYGSIDNYIRIGLGIDDETRARLKARYLE